MWALFELLKKMKKPQQDFLILPDDILMAQHLETKRSGPKLRMQQDVGQDALVEDAKWEYLWKMHDLIDREWGGSRSILLHFARRGRGNARKQVRIESSVGIETESDDGVEVKQQLTAEQILMISTAQMRA